MGSLAYGDNHIIKSHGISTFGELKYNSEFQHLDYVNQMLQRWEVSIWAFGSFDSMHPYTTKGRSGSLSSIFLKAFAGTSDEIAQLWLVAKSMSIQRSIMGDI